MKRVNKQKGFTIIELVVVILLLGILTATALPRFMDVTDDAHAAVVSGVSGGLATASGLYHAQWVADSEPTTVTEFGSMRASAGGYPIGVTTTPATLNENSDCIDIFQNLLQAGGQATIAAQSAGTATAFSTTTDFSLATTDFVTRVADPVCWYAYTGQFQRATTEADDTPAFSYNTTSGALSAVSNL